MLNCFNISEQTSRPDNEFRCLILQNVPYNFTTDNETLEARYLTDLKKKINIEVAGPVLFVIYAIDFISGH